MADVYSSRRKKLLETPIVKDLDGLLILPGSNFRYLTGVGVEARERLVMAVLRREERPTAVVPRLEADRLEAQLGGFGLEVYGDAESTEEILGRLKDEGILREGTYGVEETFPLWLWDEFRSVTEGVEFTDVSRALGDLRRIKSEEEVAEIESGCEILGRVFRDADEVLLNAKSERDARFSFYRRILDLGSEEVPFCMVASGPNSADPHATASGRSIENGDVVVVDLGCRIDGYVADITRTFFLGSPVEEFREVYEVVKRAQEAAISSVEEGVVAGQVDSAARSVVEEAGYGEDFIHRTGHGLGLDVHEEPYLKNGEASVMENGMVFTVEPGVYLQGRFGVRIEDDVALKDGEAIILSSSLPREMDEYCLQ